MIDHVRRVHRHATSRVCAWLCTWMCTWMSAAFVPAAQVHAAPAQAPAHVVDIDGVPAWVVSAHGLLWLPTGVLAKCLLTDEQRFAAKDQSAERECALPVAMCSGCVVDAAVSVRVVSVWRAVSGEHSPATPAWVQAMGFARLYRDGAPVQTPQHWQLARARTALSPAARLWLRPSGSPKAPLSASASSALARVSPERPPSKTWRAAPVACRQAQQLGDVLRAASRWPVQTRVLPPSLWAHVDRLDFSLPAVLRCELATVDEAIVIADGEVLHGMAVSASGGEVLVVTPGVVVHVLAAASEQQAIADEVFQR